VGWIFWVTILAKNYIFAVLHTNRTSPLIKVVADQNIPLIMEAFGGWGEISLLSGAEITPKTVKDADLLVVRSVTRVGKRLLEESKVKMVCTATIGTDHVDLDYLNSREIKFASAPGCNAVSVSEFLVAALLALAKKKKFNLKNKSIGIVGVGRVGTQVDRVCRALGMTVKLNDPPLLKKIGRGDLVSMEEIQECDIISFHTPLTLTGQNKTFHLGDKAFFSTLKKGTAIINTSRGDVIDPEALTRGMANGKVEGLVLDVWPGEPQINPMLLEKTDIATPHVAGYSLEGKVNGTQMVHAAAAKIFGQFSPWRAELPPPDPCLLTVVPEPKETQRHLEALVGAVYPIMEDDERLRKILDRPLESRGMFFSDLRKDYPIRREFKEYTVKIPDNASVLSRILTNLGFLVSAN